MDNKEEQSNQNLNLRQIKSRKLCYYSIKFSPGFTQQERQGGRQLESRKLVRKKNLFCRNNYQNDSIQGRLLVDFSFCLKTMPMKSSIHHLNYIFLLFLFNFIQSLCINKTLQAPFDGSELSVILSVGKHYLWIKIIVDQEQVINIPKI